MSGAVSALASHVALICDYVASSPASAPPASPPVPSPAPPPPDTTPPVFTVAAVSPVDFTISAAISPARTLATITTAETNVSIVASASVPGVTFNVVGSPVTSITATGTPTTAGQTRVVLTYVRNDGTGLVLGSSTHVINVIDPSILFVAGSCASFSGRAGVPVSATLCSPSLALDVDVLAFPNVGIPGCTVSLAWTRGGTSTGVLTLAGTPTTEATHSLTVTYYALGRIVGTSAHTITITAAWTPAPSPPAPAPAPTPPTPAPVPSPPAAPAPGPQPCADPSFADVLMLHRFDAADVLTIATNGSVNGWRSTVGPYLLGEPVMAPGASNEAAGFSGLAGYRANVPTSWGDMTTWALTIECFARVEDGTGLWASGSDSRFTPLVSIINPGDELVWTMGLRSWMFGFARATALMLYRPMRNRSGGNPNRAVFCISPSGATITTAPGRFVHCAAQWSATGNHASWWNGGGGDALDIAASPASGIPIRTGAVVQVGGSCPLPSPYASRIMPLVGAVDELRITAADRYSIDSLATYAIAAASRTPPWANY